MLYLTGVFFFFTIIGYLLLKLKISTSNIVAIGMVVSITAATIFCLFVAFESRVYNNLPNYYIRIVRGLNLFVVWVLILFTISIDWVISLSKISPWVGWLVVILGIGLSVMKLMDSIKYVTKNPLPKT